MRESEGRRARERGEGEGEGERGARDREGQYLPIVCLLV